MFDEHDFAGRAKDPERLDRALSIPVGSGRGATDAPRLLFFTLVEDFEVSVVEPNGHSLYLNVAPWLDGAKELCRMNKGVVEREPA